MDINKLDYQKLVIYGVLLLIGVYFMRDMLDLNFKIPILETFEGQEDSVDVSDLGELGEDLADVSEELGGEADEDVDAEVIERIARTLFGQRAVLSQHP